MSLDFIRETFTPDFLKTYVKRIILCGGQGDPIYHGKFHDVIRYFKTAHPGLSLQITTNGSYRSKEWWEEVAGILDEKDIVVFSVDGWDQESNEKYREGCDFSSIEDAIKVMSKSLAHIRWTAIAFKFNQDRLEEMSEKAEALGCDSFTVTLSSLFGSQNSFYLDENGEDLLEPTKENLRTQWGRHQRVFLGAESKIDVQAPFVELMEERVGELNSEFKDKYIKPLCLTGMKAMYVDVDGIFYPCSWLSHPFGVRKSKVSGREIKYNDSLFVKYKSEFDLNLKSIEQVINSSHLGDLVQGWKSADQSFIECEQKCLAPWEKFLEQRTSV